MPIIKPRKGQKKSDYINFCMSQLADEYKDTKQRYAICMRTYEDTKKAKGTISVASGDEEFIFPNESDAADKEKKTLNKPFRLPSGSKKKFAVYVKNDKGNVVKVQFGDPNMEIKRDDPERRKSFRARHNCDNPGPKWKARYWSCKMWSSKPVSNIAGASECACDDGLVVDWESLSSEEELLNIWPELSSCEVVDEDEQESV